MALGAAASTLVMEIWFYHEVYYHLIGFQSFRNSNVTLQILAALQLNMIVELTDRFLTENYALAIAQWMLMFKFD